MAEPQAPELIVETEPDPESIRFLEDRLYEFNVGATGIGDGKLFGLFLRGSGGAVIGGAYGWSWGGTCYLHYLFVPAEMRRRGEGTRLLQAVEKEARTRRCHQIVVGTFDFQAPDFYRKFGFEVAGAVEGYPRGHQLFSMVKPLDK